MRRRSVPPASLEARTVSSRRYTVHGNSSSAPMLRHAAHSSMLELPMWPASPQRSRSRSFSAGRAPNNLLRGRCSSARPSSFTQQWSCFDTRSVPPSPDNLRGHGESDLAHAAAEQAARVFAAGSSSGDTNPVMECATHLAPVDKHLADGRTLHSTLAVSLLMDEPSRVAASGHVHLQPLPLDLQLECIGEEFAHLGQSGRAVRSPCLTAVSKSTASPCGSCCSFRDLSIGSRGPTNYASSTIAEGAHAAEKDGCFDTGSLQECSPMLRARARSESRRRLPPSDPLGAMEEGETTGPDCSANVITALLTGADELSAKGQQKGQPAAALISPAAPAQSVGSRFLQRIADIAALGWATASNADSAPIASSALEATTEEEEAENRAVLHFAWADEIDGPERLVDVELVAGGCRFSAELVGSFSCHGCRQLDHGSVHAKVNQDAAIICYPFGPKPPRSSSGSDFNAQPADRDSIAVFCVLDGHGHCGEVVSRAAGLRLCEELQKHPSLQLEPHVAIFAAFAATEAALEVERAENGEDASWLRRASENSGACCTLVLLRDGDILTANAGDCRAVLGRAAHKASDDWEGEFEFCALDLSEDHKADRPDEKERVEACGGQVQVSETIDGMWEPSRLYIDLARKRLGPGLTMTRAFGDWGARPLGFSAVPEVTRHAIHEDDRFIIIASDGLWELIESDQAVQIVGAVFEGGQPAQLAALSLITAAANRWFVLEGPGYRDDITCVVVYLHADLFSSSLR